VALPIRWRQTSATEVVMNAFLWVLQILLALHTATGAVWKLSHSEHTVPSLAALPHGVWLAMAVVELVCALALVLPAVHRRLGILVPVAAGYVIAEMLLFCVVALASHSAAPGELIYWLVVAVVCAFLVYGRLRLKPLGQG
jgi:hypothetical protein